MKSYYRLLALSVTAVALVVLSLTLWHQQAELARIRNAYEILAAQKAELARTVSPVGGKSAPVQQNSSAGMMNNIQDKSLAAPDSPSGDADVSQSIPKDKGPKPWHKAALAETAPLPLPENRLMLSNTSVKPLADGLVATVNFNSTSNAPTEKLALVVRLEKRSDARILTLDPVDPANYTDVAKRVSENGKFAIFTGTIKDANAVSFNLSLSGPDTVDVRGSCGITPFLLDVDAKGTAVRTFTVP